MQLERNAIKNPIKNDGSSNFTLPILEYLNKKKMQVQKLYPNKLHFNSETNNISIYFLILIH